VGWPHVDVFLVRRGEHDGEATYQAVDLSSRARHDLDRLAERVGHDLSRRIGTRSYAARIDSRDQPAGSHIGGLCPMRFEEHGKLSEQKGATRMGAPVDDRREDVKGLESEDEICGSEVTATKCSGSVTGQVDAELSPRLDSERQRG